MVDGMSDDEKAEGSVQEEARWLEYVRTYRVKVKVFLESLMESVWLRPTVWLMVMATFATALVFAEWELSKDPSWGYWPILFRVEADAARGMLGAIAGSTLTVVSLAFSLMMVVVIQAANAYTPRLLRRVIADEYNHHVIGFVLGSFGFTLFVLRHIRDEPPFVPHVAVNVSLGLSILSVFALLAFINNVARSIEVGQIIELIRAQIARGLERDPLSALGRDYDGDVELSGRAVVLSAPESGYMRRIEYDVLTELLEESSAVYRVERALGQYVLEGSPLVTVIAARDAEEDLDELGARLLGAVLLDSERSAAQDVCYGFQQLTDVALRALSPGLNDPATGIMALNVLLSMLRAGSVSVSAHHLRADDAGELRVIMPGLTLDALVHDTIWPIIEYGAEDASVMLRLIEGVGELARQVDEPGPLHGVLAALAVRVEDSELAPPQRARMERALDAARVG